MKTSVQTLALKKAYRKGYHVTKSGVPLDKNGNIVKTSINKDGYKYFTFKFVRDGEEIYRQVHVHRLQAYGKYGDVFTKKNTLARHLNGDKLDNSYNNIFIGDAADNREDFLRVSKGRRSKTITFYKRSFGRYELLLKKRIVD